MEVKNKELKKLYDSITLYFDSWCLPPLSTAFMDCDDAIEGEIAAIKDELTDAKRGRAIFRADADHLRNIVLEKDDELRTANDEIESLKKTIDELKEKLNIERKHGEELADVNRQLASENADLKAKTGQLRLLEHSRITWRSRAQHAEKEVEDLNKKIHELEEKNANLRATPADANTIEVLKRENSELKTHNELLSDTCKSRFSALFEARKNAEQYKKSFMEHYEENDRLHKIIDGLEKEINDLKKEIQYLKIENDNLRVTPEDLMEENERLRSTIESMNKANDVLRRDNEILWAKLKEADIPKHPKRIWHADGNAWTCCENLAKAIEFQNKKIEELEAEKARLKEAYDIHEATIKRLKLLLGKEHIVNEDLKKEDSKPRMLKEDLSYGHEFKFGDKVYVPWSDAPYMYIKTPLMYNTRTESLVYVGKTQHLKWFGERFEIK